MTIVERLKVDISGKNLEKIDEFDRMLVKEYEILRCANADRKVTNNLWSDVMNECLLKELTMFK